MKILIAPDSLKGSISAADAANAIEAGILSALPGAQCVKLPLADGGEGTVLTLSRSMEGELILSKVEGPLGSPVYAVWCLLPDGTAVIEMAAASGLLLVSGEKKDPLAASTFGTGQLIKAALDKDCKTIIIGIGGSATTDGGVGMASALGFRFLGRDGSDIGRGGGSLRDLCSIDASNADPRLGDTVIRVACDVDNPLTGPMGAAAVYSPQKGADAAEVRLLDDGLRHLADVCTQTFGTDCSATPGAGAAGGLGFGLMTFLHATLERGVELVLDAVRFDEEVSDCDLVITAEGRFDAQTGRGKVPYGVANRASRRGVPVALIAGSIHGDPSELGIHIHTSLMEGGMTLSEAMKNAASLLEKAGAELIADFDATLGAL